MSHTYKLKQDKAVLSLKGLHEWALYMAQTAVVTGGASPRAVLRELLSVVSRLKGAGWDKLPRQVVVEQATMTGDQ